MPTASFKNVFFSYLKKKDILQQVTTASTGRKKRAVDEPFRDWVTGLGQGGIQSLNYEIAATVLPLVVTSTHSAIL